MAAVIAPSGTPGPAASPARPGLRAAPGPSATAGKYSWQEAGHHDLERLSQPSHRARQLPCRPGCTDQRVPGAFPDIRHVDGDGPAGHPHASVPARSPSLACRLQRFGTCTPAIGARRQPASDPDRCRGDTARRGPSRPGNPDPIPPLGHPPAERTVMPQATQGAQPPGSGRGEDGCTPNQTICVRPPTPTRHLSRMRNRRSLIVRANNNMLICHAMRPRRALPFVGLSPRNGPRASTGYNV